MSADEIIEVGVDTEEAEQDLAFFRERVKSVAVETSIVMSKLHTSAIALFTIFGQTIPMTFQLLTEAAFQAAEVVTTIATAETVGIVTIIQASLHAAIAVTLFMQALSAETKKLEAESKLRAGLRIINTWSSGF